MNVLSPTAIVPLRALPVFAATVKATDPFPVPDDPLPIVIHEAPADAVHAHVGADVVTVIDPLPPVSATD